MEAGLEKVVNAGAPTTVNNVGVKDWQSIWFSFAAYAFIILILFLFIFRHKHNENEVDALKH